jgi:23S rRNA (cytosine1962-C5)-methyltransferase
MSEPYQTLVLKPKKEKRILDGEFWIYAGEIADPLDRFQPGEPVILLSSDKTELGMGYINPLSTIAFRLIDRDPRRLFDIILLRERITQADKQRKTIRPLNSFYRMVYSEADFLPGLVIDRYDTHLVVQITTAGMEKQRDAVMQVLTEIYPQATLIEKAIRTPRIKEGLDEVNRIVSGDSAVIDFEINRVRLGADLLSGQKTGFFLDQRDNYRLLENIARDARVVDAFAYAGAWGLHALHHGAAFAEFIEISAESCGLIERNLALNKHPEERFQITCVDAFRRLKELSQNRSSYDLVILDPPAFVKSKHKVREAVRGYKEINLRALHMLRSGGHLISCSCSHFLDRQTFVDTITEAARDAKRRIKLIEFKSQPYDHAILLPMEHGEYLKCALFAVC